MSRSDTEVVVVGGGAAGLAAARRLADAKIDYLIVEARERLGGRAWTVTAGGFPVDLGCGWLHSADRNPWREIAAAQHAAVDTTSPPWMRRSPDPGFPATDQEDFIAALQRHYERLGAYAESAPDVAAATLLDPGCRWNPLLDAISTWLSGAELDRISVRDFARYHDSGINWRLVEGYGSTIAAYGAGLRVALDCRVLRVDHRGPRLRLETPKGNITTDVAIITVPSRLIAEERITFTPALPYKVDAAAGLPLGLADKLFLRLDGAEEFEKDSRLFGRTDSVATASYHVRPFGRPLIEVYFGGRLAADLEADGARVFADFARSELTGLFGSDFARRIAPLAQHLWLSDPFAGGSYSFALPGKADCREALAAPVDGRLFFAGEACSRHDFSTAHGAYHTGLAAAQAAIAALRQR